MIARIPAQVLLGAMIGAVFALFLAKSAASAQSGRESRSAPVAETAALPEYRVKSAMLYHFARFTKWPLGTFADADRAYRFCVIGQDPFGPDLDALVAEAIRGRHIVVNRLRDARHAKTCHLLFIAKSEEKSLPAILEQLAERPILTIADMEGFARKGGIIELKLVEDRVRFEINLNVAKQNGLTFRSELLLLADTISGELKRNRFEVLTH